VNETAKHKQAFEAYYAMKPYRSLTKLAKMLGRSKNTTRNWSREFEWQRRCEERDRDVAKVVTSKTIQEEVEARVRNKAIVQLALVTLARQISQGKVRGTLSDLDKLVRLEAFLDGQADSRQEVIQHDLRGKTADELKALLRREIAELAELAEYEVVGEEDGRPDAGSGGRETARLTGNESANCTADGSLDQR
jgi:hypothetical protein